MHCSDEGANRAYIVTMISSNTFLNTFFFSSSPIMCSFQILFYLFISVQFSHSVVSDSLWPLESQHTRPPCSSPSPGVHSDSRPSSPWCHAAISSSVVPFSSCPQSLPASEFFPMSQLFSWSGQSTGVSVLALFLPKKSQKTKIVASGPITSWEIDGETVETVSDFTFWVSKITADGDFSHEIKRCLLLGRKLWPT